MVTLVWSRRTVGKSSCTRRSCRESEQPVGINFNQNSRPYIILYNLPHDQNSRPYIILYKLPHDPHDHASSPTQCLFFIVHGLHPRNAYCPLVTAYTQALFVFH